MSLGLLEALIMRSSDIQNSIVNGDVSRLKAIKGIGEKTAQRIIVDLKSKVGKENFGSMPIIGGTHNNLRSEALIHLKPGLPEETQSGRHQDVRASAIESTGRRRQAVASNSAGHGEVRQIVDMAGLRKTEK